MALGRRPRPALPPTGARGRAIAGTAAVLARYRRSLPLAGARQLRTRRGSFLGWQVGWDLAARLGPVHFWRLNLGLFIPALVRSPSCGAGRGAVVEDRLLRRYYPPFAALLPCCRTSLRLSPVDLGQHQVHGLVARRLRLPRSRCSLARPLASRGMGASGGGDAVRALTLSGGLDLWRAASDKIVLQIILPEGECLRRRHPRNRRRPAPSILHAPAYNSEVYLTGRRTL